MSSNCEECFKIVCRMCKWEPDVKQVEEIQTGTLTACPECGWVPGKEPSPRKVL